MKVMYMDPFVAYSIFVAITAVLALWAGKKVRAETKRLAAENKVDNYC